MCACDRVGDAQIGSFMSIIIQREDLKTRSFTHLELEAIARFSFYLLYPYIDHYGKYFFYSRENRASTDRT